ncbi:Peroxiredoxin [Metallosphaera sp. J1]|uniref:peroxiredoxin n=1 Tax=Metallosphaera javensis (ex Hofmann et al. 2022) TaxID=99938 RepID=UPI001EDF0B81|nr:peroxiredoxin [Metallosphaera javensis (ex Hofmann et al. 2022)]MCG3109466.1 Peroxiredoxin [Metallosphaera javensis (ex Hofmann et al. 2022)]
METQERIPLIGEKFPEMEVDTTQGRMKLPEVFSGKWFVIFSHPGDFTPVCTTEFYSFAKRYQEFKNLNTELIGLSVDSNISHIEWVNWIEQNLKIEIPFPIIADPMGNVAKKLGMLHAESSTATVRAVFIVDPKGIVRLIMYYPLEIGRNISEILRSIKALQLVDKTGNVIPANWPNNEMIGDNVLNPPPRTVKDSRLRLQQFKGFAWWLTYREADKKEVEEAKKLLSQN